MAHALSLQRERNGVPAAIEDDDEHGQATRALAGRVLYDLNVKQYCAAGLNFGYYYDQSPVIIYDGAGHPSYSMDTFTASTVPGCRLPHFELADGTSLYDSLSNWFTLLVFDGQADTASLTSAAELRGLPLKILHVESGYDLSIYGHKFVISRPDFHVAWRGNAIPADALGLVDKLRGAP